MTQDSTGLVLVIREADLEAAVIARMKAAARGTTMLDEEDGAATLGDGVIRAVIRRVLSLAPNGTKLAEVELGLKLEGKLFGSGISGDVKAKFAPVTS
jgi:hypothetical protein